MSRSTFLGLSLRKSSAASEVVTLQLSPAPLPNVKRLLDLLEKVPACTTFWIAMG